MGSSKKKKDKDRDGERKKHKRDKKDRDSDGSKRSRDKKRRRVDEDDELLSYALTQQEDSHSTSGKSGVLYFIVGCMIYSTINGGIDCESLFFVKIYNNKYPAYALVSDVEKLRFWNKPTIITMKR